MVLITHFAAFLAGVVFAPIIKVLLERLRKDSENV